MYPTVSTDPTDHSDMNADPAELNVVKQQFARFGSVCRLYAPMYRQVTLAGLRKVLAGGGDGTALTSGVGYDDVRDAWRYYLEHDNKGRGYVLVSHSQGTFVLTRLIREEIEGKPAQARMVSALGVDIRRLFMIVRKARISAVPSRRFRSVTRPPRQAA